MSKEAIDGIRERTQNGETRLALDELTELTNNSSPELRHELSLYISRFNRLYREYRLGVITREEYNVDLAKLDSSILQFLDELMEQAEDQLPLDITIDIPAELPEDTAFEKIIGVDNLKQINWLRKGLEMSVSVCRIITPFGKGTGFLVGAGLLMTNNHVIPKTEVGGQSVAEFNYEVDSVGNELHSYRYQLNADVFHTSPSNSLDYTIIGVLPNPELPPLEHWGMLRLSPTALPFPNEHVTIIQHPQGGFKKIAVTANQVVNRRKQYLSYTTDTMKGSSGSPVFNDAWEVVAIHHAYGGIMKDAKGNQRHVNEGILMEAIKPDAGELWPS